ncbi:MAG: AAA family ATPase [Terriglobales bacterium]
MRIESIRLQNFRSHRDTTFELERVNIVKGPNGAGKSSIQMAIEALLTGQCAVTDAAGRGAEALIHLGAKEFVIEAVLVSKGADNDCDVRWPVRFTRTTSGGMLTVGNMAAGKSAMAWIQQHVAPFEVLSSVLNSHRFLEMSAKEQKSLLAGALKAEPVVIDAEIMKAAADSGNLIPAAVASAEMVDTNYQLFYGQRTNLNRELKSFGDISAPVRPKDLPENATLHECRSRIYEISQERDRLQQKRGSLIADHQSAKTAKEAARAQIEQHKANVIESTDEMDKLARTCKRKTDAAKADREVVETQAKVTDLRRLIAASEGSPRECPTCQRAYDEQSLAKMAEHLDTLRASLIDAEAALTAAQEKRRKIGDPDQAEVRLQAHKVAMLAISRAEETLKRPDAVAPDTSSIDTEIATLDERLSKGRAIEKQIIELEAAERQYHGVAEKKSTLERKLAALEQLIAYFGPNGSLKTKLIGDRLPAFRNRINEVLARFGFGCAFELDPYVIRVSSVHSPAVDSNGLELHQLSESEAYRFGIAFQIALAEATGVKLVVIDRADMLTPDARRQLSAELMSSSLDQAIVLTTGAVGETQYTPPPDTAFFEIESVDGVSGIIGRYAPARDMEMSAVQS